MELTLPAISDEVMRQSLTATRAYTVAILHRGPAYDPPRSDPTIWEHGRRNFALRAAGLLSIVCPIRDDTTTAGIGVFAAEPAEVERILAGDPAIQAGILTYEVHPTRSFPGDCLATGDGQSPAGPDRQSVRTADSPLEAGQRDATRLRGASHAIHAT